MAGLRQSTRTKREAPSRAATPQTRLKRKNIVPSPPASDEPARSKPKVTYEQASTRRTPARPRAPTATDLASIPTGDVRNSAPAGASEATSPRVEVQAVLTKMMGNRLSPEELANYQLMILYLVRRDAKEAKIRNRYHPALIDFFKDRPQAVLVHNKFAKVYNTQFEGQHARFHLPVYEEADLKRTEDKTGQVEEEKEMVKFDKSMGKRKRSARVKRDRERSNDPFFPQMDGTMNDDPSDQTYDTATSTSTTPRDAPPTSSEDIEMINAGQPAPSVEVRSIGLDPASSRESCQESQAGETPTASAESLEKAQQPTQAEQTATMRAISQPSEDGRSADGASMSLAQENDDPHEPSAQTDDVEMTDGAADVGIGDTVQNSTSLDVATPSTAISPTTLTSADSARSYLAWLHHRQTRFPNVEPKRAEFAIIAERLGRVRHHVFQEAMYHWGLETGNDRSEWYKQNRLEVLGEDPRFDEETMGWWAAWVKKGMNEKAEKERRKR